MTTDENTPVEPQAPAPEAPDSSEDTHGLANPPAGPEQPKGRRRDPAAEAGARRRQLRETEAERDRLAGLVETMQRREAERIAADRLAAPGDLWDIAGTELDDLLDEHGAVNSDAVNVAVDALIETRPGLARPRTTFPSMGGGHRSEPTGTPVTWAEVVRGH